MSGETSGSDVASQSSWSFAERHATRRRWVWDTMIPEGTLTFVVGPGGDSKSTLVTHLAARLSTGTLPGDYREPTPVLYINSEDDPDVTVYPNLLNAGADMNLVHGASDLSLPDDLDSLLITCESTGAKVIILDPLVPQFSGSLSSYQGVQKRLKPVINACARRGITLIAVHHTTKELKKPSVSSMLGSVGLSTVSRQVLFVGRTREARVIGVVKSNVGLIDHGWVYDVTREPIAPGSDITGAKVNFVRRAMQYEIAQMYTKRDVGGNDVRLITLLLHVQEQGRANSAETREFLEKACGIRHRSAVQAVSDAVALGLVYRIGSAQSVHELALTADGEDFLADVVIEEHDEEEVEAPATTA
jgi:AAA domain